MIEFQQALSSISTAFSFGKNMIEVRDSAKANESLIKFQDAIIDAQNKIMAAQVSQSQLSDRVQELEQECMRLKDWDSEKQKYSRRQIADGVFAYIENDFVGDFKEAHKYCCNCFDNNKKSTLQQFRIDTGMKTGLSCHNSCPDLVFLYYRKNENGES